MSDIQAEKPEEEPQMRPCVVCGRWMALSKESQRVYCCEECSFPYETCRICGRHFPRGTGPEAGLCSPSCKEELSQYFPLFKELVE